MPRAQTAGRPGDSPPAAAIAAIGLLASACSGGAKAPSVSPSQSRAQASASASAHAAALAKDLKITPADGSHNVDPAAGITVTAVKGKVTNVTVTPSGAPRRAPRAAPSPAAERRRHELAQRPEPGRVAVLHRDRHRHRPQRREDHHDEHVQDADPGGDLLDPYLRGVQAELRRRHADHLDVQPPDHGQGGGRAVAQADHVQPGDRGLVLGRRRAAVLPAPGTTGRPTPRSASPGTSTGCGAPRASNGTHRDLTQTFLIGRLPIAVVEHDHAQDADLPQRQAGLQLAGQLGLAEPADAGRDVPERGEGQPGALWGGGGPAGSSGHYDELVNYAVRFTYSGSYYHSAPWLVGAQGITNVSHGCVNLPPADAKIYYDMSVPGDPITVTASTAAGKWDDGWTVWFFPWSKFLKGSALGMAVQAGPQGSMFVSPDPLPADTATAPLQTSAAVLDQPCSPNFREDPASGGSGLPRGLRAGVEAGRGDRPGRRRGRA